MTTNSSTILIADDQRDVLEALRLLLKSEGLPCLTASSPAEVLETLARRSVGVLLMDLNYTRDTTSGREGLELLGKVRALDADLPVVVMTAWGSIEVAVEAMRLGAADFVEKPWDNARLLSILRNQQALRASKLQARKLERENEILRGEDAPAGFIADSPPMRALLEAVRRVAPTRANLLILGENGTGKGVIADLVHRQSSRADKPFVKVNMGGIPDTIFEAEMFGHVRGAFTDAKGDRIGRFELADGGTLFMDEIGNIPMAQQPKLLRVLEDGEFERLGSSRTQKVDVRLVSATNADLAVEVAEGRFRKDLLYRMNTVELRLPPLRERGEDIVPLARSFLSRFGRRYGRDDVRLGPGAERALAAYPWPGNVRELSHLMERAVLLASGAVIEQLELGGPAEAGAGASAPDFAGLTLDQAEERMIRAALERSAGNIQRAADALGLSRPALYRRLEKYGIGGDT